MKRKVQNKTEGLNESIKNLEEGKDYVNVHDNSVIVIDRLEILENRGFEGKEYKNYLSCSNPKNWREATKEEVIEAFEKHLPHRFGEDWRTMKIKERHPNQFFDIDDSSWNVEISRDRNGWRVWNKHGLLYRNGFWVERLEEVEEPKITIQDAIKANTVIRCETEEEANRILGMAHELGYGWHSGKLFKDFNNWSTFRSNTCYRLEDGLFYPFTYYEDHNYTIIPSTQIK